MGSIQKEGAEHSFVVDTNKFACSYCQGTTVQVSKLGDEPEDVTEDSDFSDLGLENATYRTATVGLCQCGHSRLLTIQLFDTLVADGTTTPALTNLDATVANGLAGWFLVVLIGTDVGKYVLIDSNTVATPTVPTLAFAVDTDADGICYFTNVEPVGLTRITA